ncbi:hypothetical protein WA158_006751 [Blastocystis sp. Blastoise]
MNMAQSCSLSTPSLTDSENHSDSSLDESGQMYGKRRRNKNFICQLCNKRFYDNCHLRDHLVTHTKEKAFECPLCSKRYARQNSLSTHMKSHNTTILYKCNYPECDATFTNKLALNYHQKIHENRLIFACSYPGCKMCFENEDLLNIHLKEHTPKELFYCEFPNCAKYFTTLRAKKLHINRCHFGDELYTCKKAQCIRYRERSYRFLELLKSTREQLKKYKYMFSLLSPVLRKKLRVKYNENHESQLCQVPEVVPSCYLSSSTPYICYVIGCGCTFSSYGKLYNHSKIHPNIPLELIVGNQYPISQGPKYCPVLNCPYSENHTPLSSLHSLRRHYLSVHQSNSTPFPMQISM